MAAANCAGWLRANAAAKLAPNESIMNACINVCHCVLPCKIRFKSRQNTCGDICSIAACCFCDQVPLVQISRQHATCEEREQWQYLRVAYGCPASISCKPGAFNGIVVSSQCTHLKHGMRRPSRAKYSKANRATAAAAADWYCSSWPM